jgi:hypothetical protein
MGRYEGYEDKERRESDEGLLSECKDAYFVESQAKDDSDALFHISSNSVHA